MKRGAPKFIAVEMSITSPAQEIQN